MNVSLYLELHGQNVTSETVGKAFSLLQAEHPVLRAAIEFSGNDPTFVETANSTLRLTTATALYPKWQSKLQEFANEFKDWSEAIVYMELASSGDQHQLFLTINHAGTHLQILLAIQSLVFELLSI